MWRKIIALVCIVAFVPLCRASIAKPHYKHLWKAVLAESADGNYDEMYAISCVFKNRLDQGMPLGSVGYKRRDLQRFVDKQSLHSKEQAKRVIVEVFESDEPYDTTNGATYFESVHYRVPGWVHTEKLVKSVRVGEHVFYRKKGK